MATPDQRTIDEVVSFLEVEATRLIKTLIFKADDELIVVLSRGDHEINDIKLKNVLGANSR